MTNTPEFSREIGVRSLPRGGKTVTIDANAEERTALARRFGLISLGDLRAKLTLTPGHGDTVLVAGALSAAVVQRCVVTLEPLPAAIEDEIEAVFADGEDNHDVPEIEVDPVAPEVEALVGGRIDLGELVAQHLSLALDPYPRSPDAPPPAAEEPETPVVRRSPFSVLKGGAGDGSDS